VKSRPQPGVVRNPRERCGPPNLHLWDRNKSPDGVPFLMTMSISRLTSDM
jgi:hypothetical protein